MSTYHSKQQVKTLNQLHRTNFHIHRIDQNTRSSEWKVNRIDRPYSVFWYVTDGVKEIKVNDTFYRVKRGDFVVFPSQIPFEIIGSVNKKLLHHFEVALEIKLGPFDLMTLYKFPIVTNLEENVNTDILIHFWKRLKNEWDSQKKPSSDYQDLRFELTDTINLLQFNALILEWFVEVLLLLKLKTINLFPTLDSRFQHLFYFIDDNLSEKITLKKLAEEVFLSESHLSLLFRQNLNMAPMEYVRNMRMQKAKELLLTSTLSLKEIAELIGFEDQSQLSRAFRRNIGISPTAYRQNRDFI